MKKEMTHLQEIKYLRGINGETLAYDKNKCYLIELSIRNLYNKIDWSKLRLNDNMLLDSYSSATIEGAITTMQAVELVCKGRLKPSKSEYMVLGTLGASKYLRSRKLSQENIINTWKNNLASSCDNGANEQDGYRDKMVYIGTSIKVVHTPQKPEKIEESMDELIKFINYDKSISSSCIAHFYFSYIHPFVDGNGRMARILNQKILYDLGMKEIYKATISTTMNNHLNMYYTSFKESELVKNNILDITPTVIYLLNIIKLTLETILINNSTLSKDEEVVSKHITKYAGAEITVSKVSKKFNITESKARYILNKLVDRKLLCKTKIENKNYYYKNTMKG